MANTYSQIYFHIVFAVKGRNQLIADSWKNELCKFITGVVTNKGQKLMIINCMPDHVHILLGTKPDCNLSTLVKEIKANSSRWINQMHFATSKFAWQRGYGVFSVGHSQVNMVCGYIKNQSEHHRRKTFREEYLGFLKNYEIDFDEKYIFSSD